MKITFKNIINDLEKFADDHAQINEFGWGDVANITTKDHNYPLMWVTPIPGTIDGTLMSLSFEILICDLQKQDDENLKDVFSDTLLIGNDVIAEYFENEDQYDFTLDEDGVTITPFSSTFDDHTAGWIFEVNIDVDNSYNSCAIPKN